LPLDAAPAFESLGQAPLHVSDALTLEIRRHLAASGAEELQHAGIITRLAAFVSHLGPLPLRARLFAVVDAAAYHQAANQVKSVRILLLNEPIMNHCVPVRSSPLPLKNDA
jgi:hypothetical protein